MFVLVSCTDDKENDTKNESGSSGALSNTIIMRQDDLSVRNDKSAPKQLVSVDSVTSENQLEISYWDYEKNNDGSYSMHRVEKATVSINDVTVIQMGDIWSKDSDTKLADYDKSSDLAYFLGNAAREYEGNPLYFDANIKDGYVVSISLFWDMYFAD